MVDVVFVIMLFFMVMVGSVKVEKELSIKPPRGGEGELPYEVVITIEEDGVISMNEQEFDSAVSTELPSLTRALSRLQADAEARGAKVLVTLQAEQQAGYQRIINVLNSLASARIPNVTLTVGDEQ